MVILRQLFVAYLLRICAAVPVITNPGEINELSLKGEFHAENGAVPESGVLADRLAIDAGTTAFHVLHNPTNPGTITAVALLEALSIVENSFTYASNVISDPTNIGDISILK
ncbi:hypothetical protein TWF718_007668 [Orbilia javanica]|uniref:Uncharacterized protein n=1 Tax=Orbilia javanica TaxID=47235 RepID=A0AAN8RDE4_9PEZI